MRYFGGKEGLALHFWSGATVYGPHCMRPPNSKFCRHNIADFRQIALDPVQPQHIVYDSKVHCLKFSLSKHKQDGTVKLVRLL